MEQSRAADSANPQLLKKNRITVTAFSPTDVTKLRQKLKLVIAQSFPSVAEATVSEAMAELANIRR